MHALLASEALGLKNVEVSLALNLHGNHCIWILHRHQPVGSTNKVSPKSSKHLFVVVATVGC